jgi:hypothetical protein
MQESGFGVIESSLNQCILQPLNVHQASAEKTLPKPRTPFKELAQDGPTNETNVAVLECLCRVPIGGPGYKFLIADRRARVTQANQGGMTFRVHATFSDQTVLDAVYAITRVALIVDHRASA